jgi:hypothetical protein
MPFDIVISAYCIYSNSVALTEKPNEMRHLLTNPLRIFFVGLFLFSIIIWTTSCHYFKVKTYTPNSEAFSLETVEEMGWHFIVHDAEHTYSYVDIQADSLTISGYARDTVEKIHYYKDRLHTYKKDTEGTIIHEVHFYLQDGVVLQDTGYVEIPATDIKEIRIIDHNNAATVTSYLFGTVGVVLGAALLIAIIVALTKSSCPYVYADNGETFIFEGEMYGGAIMQNMERADYVPLPHIKANDGQYRIRISNELKEKQYTNFAHLLTVNHPVGTQVLLDRDGVPQLIANPQAPVQATSTKGEVITDILLNKDQKPYLFDDPDSDLNQLKLNFNKPDAEHAKLVLRTKNTLWGDYLVGEFYELFGTSYDNWMQKQSEVPASERVQKYNDHQLPLSIYLKTLDGWQLIERIPTVGPMAYRDFVISLPSDAITDEQVEIKLETGFMFWEVDYVALDASSNEALTTNRILPMHATGQGDVLAMLAEDDNQYLEQFNVGDVATLSYEAPPVKKGAQQSVFLHTKGYYEWIRDYQDLPRIGELQKFKTPGYMATFSRAKYMELMEDQMELLVKQ